MAVAKVLQALMFRLDHPRPAKNNTRINNLKLTSNTLTSNKVTHNKFNRLYHEVTRRNNHTRINHLTRPRNKLGQYRYIHFRISE